MNRIAAHLISAVAAIALAAGSLVPCAQAQSGFTVRINNQSDYAVHYIYMSSVGNPGWQADLLGQYVLPTGYHVTLPGSYFPGYYDLKLVDEDGDVCIVPAVYVSGNTVWDITDAWLLNCEFR